MTVATGLLAGSPRGHTFLAIAGPGKAPLGLLDRMAVHGPSQPGHYKLKGLPSSVWPPAVERGGFITQRPAGQTFQP